MMVWLDFKLEKHALATVDAEPEALAIELHGDVVIERYDLQGLSDSALAAS